MSAVSEETLQEIREDLEARRAELINKSKLAQNEIRDSDQYQGGRDSLDESTDEQGMSTRLRFADRDRNLIMKINDALERIANDEYGYCESCEEEINEKRLRARPMTTMCIDCKEEQEREEARTKIRPGMMDEYE
ncbi:TraR/DksA family transcriptional regulator [Persicimonas caeni]|nr:TraR/DksA C4-type zinc finger protein [Persicimonas caeni]